MSKEEEWDFKYQCITQILHLKGSGEVHQAKYSRICG